jgi:hypothetical protein
MMPAKQVPVVEITIDSIMRKKPFRQGVADARAGRSRGHSITREDGRLKVRPWENPT